MAEQLHELAIDRLIAAPPARVWQVMTERLAEWWCPRPWKTRIIALELRPGGRCAMEMQGPDGETSPIDGVVLEVVPERKFVFTQAFTAGWVPQKPFMVGIFSLTPEGASTRYHACARHWDEETMQQHEAMGFQQGWSKVAAQLAELAEAG